MSFHRWGLHWDTQTSRYVFLVLVSNPNVRKSASSLGLSRIGMVWNSGLGFVHTPRHSQSSRKVVVYSRSQLVVNRSWDYKVGYYGVEKKLHQNQNTALQVQRCIQTPAVTWLTLAVLQVIKPIQMMEEALLFEELRAYLGEAIMFFFYTYRWFWFPPRCDGIVFCILMPARRKKEGCGCYENQ